MSISILYIDTDLLVCVKPAGVATQTARLTQQDMVSLLRNQLSAQGEASEIHVVHRLDQPVEGILVFARNSRAAAWLDKQVSDASGHAMKKEYLAEVAGVPDPPKGRLENFLIKDAKTNTSRVTAAKEPGAKKASLSYETVSVDAKNGTSLVRVRLETGRHHQIRVQMAHAGHPLTGDTKYGPAEGGEKAVAEDRNMVQTRRAHRTSGNDRTPLKLCACHLEFTHPCGEKKSFEIPPTWLA